MKVKTNLRAGKGAVSGKGTDSGGTSGGHGADNAPEVVAPPPPVYVRCVGF